MWSSWRVLSWVLVDASTLAVAESYGKAGFWRLDTPETRLTGPVRGCEREPMTRSRVVRRWLSLTGYVFAVFFYCASLTPSLLPRSVLFQGVVSGLTAVLGYALGATLSALGRRLPRQAPPRAERILWRVVLVLSPVVILLFLALGTRWQQDLRTRLDMPRVETYDILTLVGVSVLTFAVFLLIARAVRLGTRSLVRLLARWVPRPVAYAAGVLVVGYLLFGVV